MRKAILFGAASILSAGMPASALAAPAPVSAQITAVVPEVCDIVAGAFTLETQVGRATGTVSEMCNSGRQFRVLASYRPLEAGERVQIDYAGQVSRLDASGMSEIAHRRGPTVAHVPVSIEASGLVRGIAISLGMTAI